MKLAILTTETLHHLRFVQQVAKRFPIAAIYLETEGVKAPFPTAHAFEAERDSVERDRWFASGLPAMADFAPVVPFASMNDQASLDHVRELVPDVGIVFGTGRLKAPLIDLFHGHLYNLHGGDPEEYRGLDSHMWAIYHRDFDGLVTTIHRVNPTLDDGEIILQAPIPLHHGMPLSELRACNTEVCEELALGALSMERELGHVVTRPQRRNGRYYSFMPADLKAICVKRFAAHTRALS